MKKSIRNI